MNIKNLISGTVNNVVNKVKDVAENSNVKETVKDLYDQGSSKVQSYGLMAKLSLELVGDKDELKKLYTEIGRLYFEETKEPDEFFAPLFEQARDVYERIQEKEELIACLKEDDCECECCCGDEDCCCDDECCCGDDCDCGEAEDIEVEVCEFEEVVEATEAEAVCTECCEAETPAEPKAPVEE